MSSARCVLYVNGKPLAQVTGFSWAIETQHRRVHGIDSTEPYDMVPMSTRVTGAIRLLRVTRDGGAEGAGLTVPLPDITREKYATLMLVDRRTDLVLFQAQKVVSMNQQWEAPVRGLVTGVVTFESLDGSNEVRSRQG
jgi:hypothetical protein